MDDTLTRLQRAGPDAADLVPVLIDFARTDRQSHSPGGRLQVDRRAVSRYRAGRARRSPSDAPAGSSPARTCATASYRGSSSGNSPARSPRRTGPIPQGDLLDLASCGNKETGEVLDELPFVLPVLRDLVGKPPPDPSTRVEIVVLLRSAPKTRAALAAVWIDWLENLEDGVRSPGQDLLEGAALTPAQLGRVAEAASNTGICCNALEVLASTGSAAREHAERLVPFLSAGDETVQLHGMRALAAIGAPAQAERRLLELLEGGTDLIRSVAIDALASNPELLRQHAGRLADRLTVDTLRSSAIQALAGDPVLARQYAPQFTGHLPDRRPPAAHRQRAREGRPRRATPGGDARPGPRAGP